MLASGGVTTIVCNALGLIGQNQHTLIEDKSIQPSDQFSGLVANSAAPGQLLPAGAGLAGVWTWGFRQQLLPGVPSHFAPYASGLNQHSYQGGTTPVLVTMGPSGTEMVCHQARAAPAPAV